MRRVAKTPVAPVDQGRLSICIAQTSEEIRAAQRLRHRVFAEEMQARLATSEIGLDADGFDPHCYHLLVRDDWTREVVGTYRILPGDRARRLGGFYSETEFDLGAVAALPGHASSGVTRCASRGPRDGGQYDARGHPLHAAGAERAPHRPEDIGGRRPSPHALARRRPRRPAASRAAASTDGVRLRAAHAPR